jgi:hypothetical protein
LFSGNSAFRLCRLLSSVVNGRNPQKRRPSRVPFCDPHCLTISHANCIWRELRNEYGILREDGDCSGRETRARLCRRTLLGDFALEFLGANPWWVCGNSNRGGRKFLAVASCDSRPQLTNRERHGRWATLWELRLRLPRLVSDLLLPSAIHSQARILAQDS